MSETDYQNNTNNDSHDKKDKAGMPFLIIFLAVAILAALSIVPWGSLTDNFLKDYSLIADLLPGSVKAVANELVDPELEAALRGEDEEDEDIIVAAPGTSAAKTDTNADGHVAESGLITVEMPSSDQIKPRQSGRSGEKVYIEDYTVNSVGLANLRRALANRSSRPARIAVIGDSYIEGDILTSNLRSDLQQAYGGSGVGYVPLQYELTGFRSSVHQKCSGWTTHDIRKNAKDAYKALSGEYFVASSSASTSVSGSSKLPGQSSWASTKFLFIAPEKASVTISTAGSTKTYEVEASTDVQCISIPGNTSSAKVSTTSAGLIGLGLYLDGNSGVAVDCMSLRGNSGISHRKLSPVLAQQMRQWVDYDLIIVEYGINALTSQQTNYNGYKNLMYKVITRLKACYPNADILVMGIGDRGQKVGTSIKSIPTASIMVDTQRDLARETGVLFWDTREAMGGEDAVIEWRNQNRINPDYIHLNAKGGNALGALLYQAIRDAVD